MKEDKGETKMKKWLTMVGALMLVLALSACSGESSSSDGGNDSGEQQQVALLIRIFHL